MVQNTKHDVCEKTDSLNSSQRAKIAVLSSGWENHGISQVSSPFGAEKPSAWSALETYRRALGESDRKISNTQDYTKQLFKMIVC